MIDIKLIKKPKKNESGGSKSSLLGFAGAEKKVELAKYADRAFFAQEAKYANRAGYSSRSAYADVAENITDESPIYKRFLRKDQDDSTEHLISFLAGLKLGEKFSIDENGNANLNKIKSSIIESLKAKFHELESTKLNSSEGTINTLTALTLFVKSLADVQNLNVKDTATVLNAVVKQSLTSPKFVSGFLGEGFRLAKTEKGDWNLEIDNLTVRKVFQVFELLIQEVKHQGGVIVHSPAGGKITKVTDGGSYWRCEIESADTFVKDDLVLCQQFTGKNIKRYWRLAISAGDGFVNLSKTDCEANSAIPEVDDEIATLGNKTNTARQSAYLISVVGADAPYTAYYSGINSYSLKGKEHTRIGNLEGVVSPVFGTLKGSGAHLVNAYVQGLIKLQNGKTVETVISETSSKLSSDIGKVRTELKGDISKSKEETKGEINSSVSSVRNELNSTIAKAEEQFNTGINQTKTELSSNISSVKQELEGKINTDIQVSKESITKQINQSKQEAEAAAKAYADVQDKAKLTQAQNYADGKVTAEEKRAIADANAKLAAAKKYAEAQDALLKAQQEAYADGIVTEAEQRAINEAQNRVDKAKEELNALIEGVKETVTKEIKDVEQRFEIAEGQINSHIKETTQLVNEAKSANGESIKTLEQVKVQINDINVTAGQINSTLGEVTKKQGEINSSISNLEQTAGSISASIDGFKETEAEIKATANRIEATHAGIVLEASEKSAKKAIDGLNLNNKNLILESGKSHVSKSYLIHKYKLSKKVKEGERYTLVFKGKVNSSQKFGIWHNSGASNQGYITPSGQESKVYILQYTVRGSVNHDDISFYNYSSTGAKDGLIEWACLYEGYIKPSLGWTPAPEDIDNQFTETKASLKVLNDKLVSEVSKTNGISKDLTAVKQDHNSFKVQVKSDITGAINSNNEVIKSSFEMKEDTISLLGKSIVLTGKITFNSLENSVKSKINNTELVANQAKANATTALSNIEKVKGEIPNQNFLYEESGEFLLSNDFPRNKKIDVTLSLWGDFSEFTDSTSFQDVSFGGDASDYILFGRYRKVSDSLILFEKGSINVNNSNLDDRLVLQIEASDEFTIRAAKLEIGHKATYWTPSPEDKVTLARLDSTIIDGGFIKTSLIKAKSIKADKIDISSLEAVRIRTGNLDVLEGATIAGFEIGRGRIGAIVDPTESSFGNLAIYNDFFRVGGNNGYAMLGDNVIPATAGGAFNATGRIVNRTPNTGSGYGYETANYGLFIDVEGGTRNYGLRSNQPLLAKSFISDNVGFIDFGGSSYKVDFSQYSTFLIYSGRRIDIKLPSRHSVASMFGMTNLPKNLFGFKFTFVGLQSTSQIKFIGLLNNDGSYRDYEISQSDAIDILAYTREGILYYQVVNYRV